MEEERQRQFKEMRTKLHETRNLLFLRELKLERVVAEKSENETRMNKRIMELINVKEKQSRQIEVLEKELGDQDEQVKKDIDGLQDELMCSICVEPYVEPTALNCGHMFCSKCISEWMNKKRFCPLCHQSVSTTVRIHMDALIQRTKLMSKKAETRREAHLSQQKKRKSLETEDSPKKLCSETETNSDAPVETTTIPVETVTYYLPSMGPSTTNHTEGNDCNQPGTSRQPPPIAVVNPSNVPVAQIPMPAAPRVQTNTSGEADTVIDLTDL